MTENSNISDREHQELTILYQVSVQDLANFKSQQWTLANYTILAFAAIIGVSSFPQLQLGLYGRFFLCLVASGIFGLAIHILWRLKTSIDIRRNRLSSIREKCSDTFRESWGVKKQVSAGEMFFFLLLILFIGLGFVWWIVYFNKLMA
jgi:hypothetical protein